MADATSPPRTMTADELLKRAGDGRCELIRGVLREMEPSGGRHGRLTIYSGALLLTYAQERGGMAYGAETGFVLERDPDTVRAPDAAYLGPERADAVGRTDKFIPGPPDLAVEVTSPDDTRPQVREKALFWIASGCRIVLVVDPPSRRVTRYRAPDDIVAFTGDQTIDCAPAMPGFAPSLAELFGDT